MTQVQDMQKRYASPALTVYGHIEDITLLWSNPSLTDNTCPGAIGSQHVNSGALCVTGGGGGGTGAVDPEITDPSLGTPLEDPLAAPVDPLAEDLTGSSGS